MTETEIAAAASDYVTEPVNETTMRKLRVSTGEEWLYEIRTNPRKSQKPNYVASNGVTLEKLQTAGFRVAISHTRWADYYARGFKPGPHGFKDSSRALVLVPSSFKKNSNYRLMACGGYTNIQIYSSNVSKTPVLLSDICLTSECSTEEPFCYKMGVKQALQKLTKEEIAELNL